MNERMGEILVGTALALRGSSLLFSSIAMRTMGPFLLMPTVKSFPGRFKASYSGFIIPETGELFVTKPEKFNYETTINSIREFLKAKPAPQGKHYVLVMDNAPWHKKTLRLIDTEKQPEYADIAASVQFLRLPPYSPDLNPIEQVWRITRKENTHNTFFASINNLTETVDPKKTRTTEN